VRVYLPHLHVKDLALDCSEFSAPPLHLPALWGEPQIQNKGLKLDPSPILKIRIESTIYAWNLQKQLGQNGMQKKTRIHKHGSESQRKETGVQGLWTHNTLTTRNIVTLLNIWSTQSKLRYMYVTVDSLNQWLRNCIVISQTNK
jgi:hypothetical protein